MVANSIQPRIPANQHTKTMHLNKQLLLFASVLLLTVPRVDAQNEKAKPVFSKNTFDLGIVVSDLDKAAKFYADVVGMTEVKGFTAPAEVATRFGLTDNKAVVVRRFVMADVENAPSLKLMAFPDAPPKRPDQKFIHSTLGWSHLTMFVNDMGDVEASSSCTYKVPEVKAKLVDFYSNI